MNSRERFETWFRKEHPNDSGIAAGWYCWQAAERDMLERAIKVFSSAGPKDTFTTAIIRMALKELLK